jgi:hypothetical protein
MMEEKRGYTLFEKWTGRAHPQEAQRPENNIFNPLKLHCGDFISANLLEGNDRPYIVSEVREYRRSISREEFNFSDYLLHRGEDIRILRANPQERNAMRPQDCDLLWLKLFYEMEFDERVRDAVTQRVFEVDNNDDGVPDVFYDALSAGQDGYLTEVRAARAGDLSISNRRLRYWDFYRKGDPKQDESEKDEVFLFVEIDEQDGYTVMLEGTRISSADIEIYPAEGKA